MMSTPQQPHRWGTHGLRRLAEAFVGQEHVGILGQLLIRLARFLGGDPSQTITVTSPNFTTPATLPDNVTAHSAVLHVTGNGCTYRTDGGTPTGLDAPVVVGSVITLTGQPTIKGFVFVSSGVGACTLTGAYYD